MEKKLNLTDKNGIEINHEDVIYNQSDYYRIFKRDDGEVEAISCTKGYLHDIKQEDLTEFKRIGTYIGNEHLFECD